MEIEEIIEKRQNNSYANNQDESILWVSYFPVVCWVFCRNN